MINFGEKSLLIIFYLHIKTSYMCNQGKNKKILYFIKLMLMQLQTLPGVALLNWMV